MPNIGGLSFSKVGFQKNLKSGTFSNGATEPSINFNLGKLIKKQIQKLISTKPKLIDFNFYQSLGFDANLVGYDSNLIQTENLDKPMSPRLMNWIEPYEISGMRKTLFYTEVNSGLKVGDRVFIINGNYDSDLLIKSDKYKKGRDGYKILFIDKCQVVLDIDYTGVLPWVEEDIDSFIKLHYVESQSDFDTVNRQLTTRGGKFDYRFNFYQNNFIYTPNTFNPTLNLGPEWGVNTGITQSGFFVRDDQNLLSFGSYSWYNMTSAFTAGSFSYALSPTYSNNDRMKVIGGSFILPGILWEFKEGLVYKWEVGPTQSTWMVDVRYSRPILTKTNFRDGNFDGIWNVGLYGRQDKRINWTGNKSTWNTGTLLNTNWIKGSFNSKFSLPESYFTEYDQYGLPFQKINGPNNNGKGYNFLIDSEIVNSTIENGSIYNTNIGVGNATYSVLEQNIIGGIINYPNKIKKAYFENCRFSNAKIENSEIRKGRSVNTDFNNIKSINSYYKQSIIKNSDYISDEIISILDYDELNISEYRTLDLLSTSATYSQRNSASHKLYRFYISKRDFDRLRKDDYFYLKNLNINDGSKKLVNFFDKKFKLGSWYEYFDDFYNPNNPYYTSIPQMSISSTVGTYSFFKRGTSMTSYLSSPKDNEYNFTTVTDGTNFWTELAGTNSNQQYSIDIFISEYDKDDNFIEGLDFDRNSTPFLIYNEESILFTYTSSNVQYLEITNPSGYYDGKPWYTLTNNTGVPFAYVFYTASNNRWETHENFNSITGAIDGSFWMSLGETGSVPISNNQSWIQQTSFTMSIVSSFVYNPSPSLPISTKKVNISPRPGLRGYIIDSDFESGIFERSNWNSGMSINYNNDLNITKFSNEGGVYDIQVLTQSSSLLLTTSLSNLHRETPDDLLKVGNVVFLNQIDYDTRGKILTYSLNTTGLGYSTSNNVQLAYGTGTQATVNITATTIGGVITTNLPSLPYTYLDGTFTRPTTPLSTSGVGLTVDITISLGLFTSVSVNNPGIGYTPGDTVYIDGWQGSVSNAAIITILSISNGEIISATISNGGLQYSQGDILTITGGDGMATLQVLSTTGSLITFDDSFKITNVLNNQITVQQLGTSSINTLLPDGLSTTSGLSNRWGYIHQSKFIKSFINSGLMRRAYLRENLLQNTDINLEDKDFNDVQNFRKLLFSEVLFRENRNLLAKASYVNSNFSQGSDLWNNGLFYNSVWNSGTFSRGIIKESSWHSGRFVSGLFYQSKSFNANPNSIFQYYDVDRTYSSWKNGYTSDIIANDRYSWRSGTFSFGEFVKSDWENGNFINGRFYNSKWYSGTFSKGIIGENSLSAADTWYYNGKIETAIVENAYLYAIDTSFNGASSSNIDWEIGTFNDGVFGSSLTQSAQHSATWNDGIFNSGEFQTNGKWKTGVFNGGKFISGFGWTYAVSNISEFGWEDGEFNGGEFGNANLATNSVWYTGEFNGGKFIGRYWQDGIFTAGDFIGSATISAVGAGSPDGMTSSNADTFVDSFSVEFYGVWGNGIVANNKDEFVKNKKLFTKLERNILPVKPLNIVNFKNALWRSGTFSHSGGTFYNSVWLNGNFMKGKFDTSSFNPYVRRNSINRTFNLDDDLILGSGSCVWQDGIFENSEFYISQWKTGRFISGTAYGMVWRGGVANYMNAYNVFWEDGLWRNGNWYGSYMIFDGDDPADFNKQILFRGMSYSGTSSTHFWNVFEESQPISSVNLMSPSAPILAPPIVLTPTVGISLSDSRLKTDITFVKNIDGMNIYRYKYIHKPDEIFEGVMAQELLDTEHKLAVVNLNGYYYVDYSKLKIELKKIYNK